MEAANATLQERLASTADREQELEDRALLEQVLTLQRIKFEEKKFETNIPTTSQLQHSCVCELLIYSHDWFAYSVAGNMWTDPANI